MQLSIEPNNGIPIYEQLVRQVKYAVAEEDLVPGQLISSVPIWPDNWRSIPTQSNALTCSCKTRTYCNRYAAEESPCAKEQKKYVADRHQLVSERLASVVDEAIRSGLDEEPFASDV